MPKKFAQKKYLLYLCTRNQENGCFPERNLQCGNSSVGRAQPCQGWGREFESRFPLNARRIALCYPFFVRFAEIFRDYIDNPSKPPFDKGGFAWSRKRATSDPKLPPVRGLGGVKIVREKCPRMRARVSFSAPKLKV